MGLKVNPQEQQNINGLVRPCFEPKKEQPSEQKDMNSLQEKLRQFARINFKPESLKKASLGCHFYDVATDQHYSLKIEEGTNDVFLYGVRGKKDGEEWIERACFIHHFYVLFGQRLCVQFEQPIGKDEERRSGSFEFESKVAQRFVLNQLNAILADYHHLGSSGRISCNQKCSSFALDAFRRCRTKEVGFDCEIPQDHDFSDVFTIALIPKSCYESYFYKFTLIALGIFALVGALSVYGIRKYYFVAPNKV